MSDRDPEILRGETPTTIRHEACGLTQNEQAAYRLIAATVGADMARDAVAEVTDKQRIARERRRYRLRNVLVALLLATVIAVAIVAGVLVYGAVGVSAVTP